MAMNPPPSRGEIWSIRFDPSVGAEIRKLRPAVVISIDSAGRLPLKVVVPVTDWKPNYHSYFWMVHLPPDPSNGLSKESGADVFQIKSLSLDRFVARMGVVTESQLDRMADAIAVCVGSP
jgi:mRNA interferase MazF